MEVKTRKRRTAEYVCGHPGCPKIFKRPDHLQRHKKNHDPKINCKWPGCELMFARTDVADKHFKRHISRIEKMAKKEGKKVDKSAIEQDIIQTGGANLPRIANITIDMVEPIDHSEEVTSEAREPKVELSEYSIPRVPLSNVQAQFSKVQASPDPDTQQNIDPSPNEFTQINGNHQNGNIIDEDKIFQYNTPPVQSIQPTFSPSDLIEWLFQGDNINPDRHHSTHNDFHGISPMSQLESMFNVSPNFPHSNNRTTIDGNIRQRLIKLIPSLADNEDFGIENIERCLEIYWLIFHPQYPILHRPSFSTEEAEPILLLAMIMIGSNLSNCTGRSEILKSPQLLSNQIAEPLRWLIFANKDCKPPAEVWVIQSLLLLETFEITSSSRYLHERAYLHHGTKIQLLRRSPILGGDPLKDEDEDVTFLPTNHLWKKWIEVESMKRVTLMAFYLDTVNATVYGHSIILYAHQLKLSLPCEDELWEFDNSKEIDAQSDRPPKFLSALRKLLHREHVNTSSFGRKILLAGLLTIMFQMQQKDIQLSFLGWNKVKDSWNETISLAVDVWRTDICSKGCCNTENSLNFQQYDIQKLPPMLMLNDTRCKFGLYHISQIYMRITHYDYIIYAGAPSRMNVTAGSEEYKIVSKRVTTWALSLNGRISVIHAYLFLFEMFLPPDRDDMNYTYDANVDPFLHRKNIMASCILVIFAYNFVLEGPEKQLANSDFENDNYPDTEDGYSYLRRINQNLKLLSNIDMNEPMESGEFHNNIIKLADLLPNISNKNHVVGLLKLFYKGFRNCNWEVGREYAKLFKNCIERSLGSAKITCDDMYINN